MEIKEFHCPICGDKFIEKLPNNRVKFLPNHWQYQVELDTGQRAWFGVCKKHKGEITKELSDELLEAHKRFWGKEIDSNGKLNDKQKEVMKSEYQALTINKVLERI